MVEYYLKKGDLIITDTRYGILVKKTSTYWHCYVRLKRSNVPKGDQWVLEKIPAKVLYEHLDKGTHGAKAIMAPGKRRRRRASSTMVSASGS